MLRIQVGSSLSCCHRHTKLHLFTSGLSADQWTEDEEASTAYAGARVKPCCMLARSLCSFKTINDFVCRGAYSALNSRLC